MSALPLARRQVASLRERLHSATPRERMMLAALVTAALLIVLSVAIKSFKFTLNEQKELKARSESNAITLEGAPAVDAALKAKSEKLANKRLSPSDFQAAVEMIARESGLTLDAPTPKTDKSGGLTIHRMRATLRAPSVRKLMDFDDRLRLKGDGYVVERVTIDARSDNGELVAIYELATCQPSE